MNPRIEKLSLPRYRRDALWKFWQPSTAEFIWGAWLTSSSSIFRCKIGKDSSTDLLEMFRFEKWNCSEASFRSFTLLFWCLSVYDISWQRLSCVRGLWTWTYSACDLERIDWRQSSRTSEKNTEGKTSIGTTRIAKMFSSWNVQTKIEIWSSNKQILSPKIFRNQKIIIFRDSCSVDVFLQLPRCLREHTLKNLLTIVEDPELEMEILGHFILHPVEFGKTFSQIFSNRVDLSEWIVERGSWDVRTNIRFRWYLRRSYPSNKWRETCSFIIIHKSFVH